jgi:hypothetical protein
MFYGDARLALRDGGWQIEREMRKHLRAWWEKLEAYWQEVTADERTGARAAVTRAALYVSSKLFEGLIKTRRFLYNVRSLRKG